MLDRVHETEGLGKLRGAFGSWIRQPRKLELTLSSNSESDSVGVGQVLRSKEIF
jgi:hypothetical protein